MTRSAGRSHYLSSLSILKGNERGPWDATSTALLDPRCHDARRAQWRGVACLGGSPARLRPRCPADSFRELFPLPRPGQQEAHGRSAARHVRGRHGGPRRPRGARAGQARDERALSAHHRRAARPPNAAGLLQPPPDAGADRDSQTLDRGGRPVHEALGVHPARPSRESRPSPIGPGSSSRSTPSSCSASTRKGCSPAPPPLPRLAAPRLLDLTGLPPRPPSWTLSPKT